MNHHEQESFEANLRSMRPAAPPEQFMARLRAAKPDQQSPQPAKCAAKEKPWWRDWRWLTPAMTAAAAVVVLVVTQTNLDPLNRAKKEAPRAAYGFRADDVKVDQELVSSFDVVAKLPSGEPVRFLCKKWKNQFVATDTNAGVEITRNSPRVEVVPVRIETY